MLNLTDHEREFADTAAGQSAIALAQRDHQLRTRYMGAHAPAFTDTMRDQAIRDGAAKHARASVQRIADAAMAPVCEAELATLRAQADAARQERKRHIANGWKR